MSNDDILAELDAAFADVYPGHGRVLPAPATWQRACTWTPTAPIEQRFEPPLVLAAGETILCTPNGRLGVYAAPDADGNRTLRAVRRLDIDHVWREEPSA